MKKNKQKLNKESDLPKIIIAFVVIFMYAMLIWAIGYMLMRNGLIGLEPIERSGPPLVQNKCMEKAKVEMTCSAVGFEFDPVRGKCMVVNGAGCIEKLPFATFKECQDTCEESVEAISVSVDKSEYEQGEIIRIVVNNGSNKSILYSGSGERFWDIEYFKDNKWINPEYEQGGGFQLTEKNTGDDCYIALFERSWPEELSSQLNLTAQWNQKICPFGTEGPDKPKIVRYIESGRYRLAFGYGFEISGNDPFRISEPKTVYSDEFTIKEKSAIDPKCMQRVSGSGMCKAFWWGIEFDQNSGKCVKRGVGGCSFETPFENIEECQKVCEKETEEIDFYACEKDSDCISVKADCCGCTAGGAAISINIKYRQEWNKKLNCAGIMCPAVMSDDPSCSQKPKCINNSCIMN